MRYCWIIILLFTVSDLFSQTDQFQSESGIICNIDSMILWSYDILTDTQKDKNLICQIIFFRNMAIQDSLFENVYQTGLKPSMCFNVYPISMVDTVKRMSKWVKTASDCLNPDIGGDVYTLKNFVLLNYSSCNSCTASSDEKTDLCRGNIEKIILKVKYKDYQTFEQLCNDLPIRKEKFK